MQPEPKPRLLGFSDSGRAIRHLAYGGARAQAALRASPCRTVFRSTTSLRST
jgi:hypothetical protein